MSGQPSTNPSGPRPGANGVGAGGIASSQQRTDPQVGSSTSNGQPGSMSQSNLNSITSTPSKNSQKERAHSIIQHTSNLCVPGNEYRHRSKESAHLCQLPLEDEPYLLHLDPSRTSEGAPMESLVRNYPQTLSSAMSSHSPSASVTLSTQSHQCAERPCVLIPWRDPSSEEHRRIDENLEMPNPAQQPEFYHPCLQLEYEAQGLLCNVTDPRPGPPYRPSLGSISALGEAGSRAYIGSAGLPYAGIYYNVHSSLKNQDRGRHAGKSDQTSNRQILRTYRRTVNGPPVSSSLGTSKNVVGNHTLDSQYASSPAKPSKHYLIQEDIGSKLRPTNFVQPVLGSIEDEMVIEYLSKKGYSKTESMLRQESANQDVEGRPITTKAEETGGAKYGKAFGLMRSWIEESLDIYKPDLRRLLWPIFVYSFLNLASDFFPKDSGHFFESFKSGFGKEHEDDLRALQPISLPEHVLNNDTAKIYRTNKYRITLSQVAFFNLVQFLESKEKDGGAVIVGVIQSYLQVVTIDRVADDQNSLARLLKRARANEDYPAEDEGIPGHNRGSANLDRNAGSTVLTRLKLGHMPLESDLMGDVRAELEEEDARNPPFTGQDSLIQHFEQRIKREESEDAPTRSELQLPPSIARDVAMEVQKVKEDRDRFKIEGRTGGVGPGVSVTMFTFHNTYDSINCLDFSEDNMLVAAGMSESYIRVWSLDGKALPTTVQPGSTEQAPSASRRLIGHSGPVYAVSFSPSIASSNPLAPSTNSKHLLSCSADKSVRLWSLETWTCFVVYKGHDHPVWDVKWGPFGLYFLTGSLDRTCRLWRTDHIEDLRMFVGHDKDVDTVCFHPNSAYVFTGSSDRIVRMWAVANGYPVRMFTGHTGNITSLACSPSGKLLASADDAGTIILWDLGPGKLKKRMRGHGKGGIWSLSWSVESTVLASGGADGTVRIWDIAVGNDASGQGRVIGEGGAGQKIDGNAAQMQAVASAGTKKKGKDVVVTSDQISAFPTKKSPVYKVRFTRQNLVVAGGAFLS